MNGYIRAKEVRVVAPDGEQIGVMKLEEALYVAEELGLDLVEVAPKAKPPVCRLMDYGKWKYEQSVKEREARKKQTRTVIKEIRLRPRTGVHDYEIIARRARKFLMEGDKVKVTIRFRGRENERPELGTNLFEKLVNDLGEIAQTEQTPQKEGRQMTGVIAPNMRAIRAANKDAVEVADDVGAGDHQEEL